jgi:hypothetical protein
MICVRSFSFKAIPLPARVGVGLGWRTAATTTGARGRGSGAGNSISLGEHPAATTASDATPNGEALGVVVVGLGFQMIEDCIGSPP